MPGPVGPALREAMQPADRRPSGGHTGSRPGAVDRADRCHVDLKCARAVSSHNPWGLFDEQAQTRETVGADAAAKVLLDRLTWWARALRDARRAQPYAA
jgi:hypothetical protein